MIKVAKGAVALSCVLAMGAGSFSLAGCASQGNPVASDAGETARIPLPMIWAAK